MKKTDQRGKEVSEIFFLRIWAWKTKLLSSSTPVVRISVQFDVGSDRRRRSRDYGVLKKWREKKETKWANEEEVGVDFLLRSRATRIRKGGHGYGFLKELSDEQKKKKKKLWKSEEIKGKEEENGMKTQRQTDRERERDREEEKIN